MGMGRGFLALVLALAAWPASAQIPDEIRGVAAPLPPGLEAARGWELEKPKPGPGGTVPLPNTGTNSELQKVWDRLQSGVFDNLCKNLKLPYNYTLKPSEEFSVGFNIDRRLERYPDRTIAIVDHVRLGLGVGKGIPITPSGTAIPLSIGVSARADGDAYVVRLLEGNSDCGQIKKLINVLDFKTILPLNRGRLQRMEPGELWKLPLVLQASASLGAGVPVGPANISATVSFTQSEGASVSLLRVSETKMLLRIRIDRANVLAASGGVNVGLNVAGPLGLEEAENLIEKEADRAILRELNRYLVTAMGASYWNREGRKALLDFTLNPMEDDQMDKLAEFLRGNVSALGVLLRAVSAAMDPLVQRGDIRDELKLVQDRNAAKLGIKEGDAKSGENSFAGASDYSRKGHNGFLRLPILVNSNNGEEFQSDRIFSGARDTALVIHQDSRFHNRAWLDVPLIGQIYKTDEQEIVRTMTSVDSNGMPQEAFLSYVRTEGHVRQDESDARRMVEKANELMSFIGVKGEGRNEALQLPVGTIFPQRPVPPPFRDGEERRAPDPTYRSAVSAFNIVFNKDALTKILWAPAALVLKAFGNALDADDRAIFELALGHSKISDAGELELDRSAIRKELRRRNMDSPSDFDRRGTDYFWEIAKLAKRGAALVKELYEARAGGWEQRVRSLADIVAGKGKSGLEYFDAVKVLGQLADDTDVFGDFRVSTNKKIKGEKDVSDFYLLNKNKQDAAYQEAIKRKDQFADVDHKQL
jgi:hypothetical protein